MLRPSEQGGADLLDLDQTVDPLETRARRRLEQLGAHAGVAEQLEHSHGAFLDRSLGPFAVQLNRDLVEARAVVALVAAIADRERAAGARGADNLGGRSYLSNRMTVP